MFTRTLLGGKIEWNQYGPSKRVHTLALDERSIYKVMDPFIKLVCIPVYCSPHCGRTLRHAAQIQVHLNFMKDVYNKLETLQKECAVTRNARPSVTLRSSTLLPIIIFDMMHFELDHTIDHVSSYFGRPEMQEQILRLCASCTKTDVALNNLVLRARIAPLFHSLLYMLIHSTGDLDKYICRDPHLLSDPPQPSLSVSRTIKAPATKAKAKATKPETAAGKAHPKSKQAPKKRTK